MWAERDNHEISETQAQMAQLRLQIESLAQKRLLLQQAAGVERAKMEEAQARFDAHKIQIDQTRTQLQQDRQRAVECERRTAQIQQTLSEMEASQRELLMKRDRLSSEHRQVQENLTDVDQACAEVKARLDTHCVKVESVFGCFKTLEEEHAGATAELRAVQDDAAKMQSEAAAKRAQIDLLTDTSESSGEFAAGSRQLLDPANPLGLDVQAVLGPLAEKFNAPPSMRLALEAALRAWLDAVVVRDAAAARQMIGLLLSQSRPAATRLVTAAGVTQTPCAPPQGLTLLLDQVTVADDFTDAACRLLGHVFLADTLDAVPPRLPEGCCVVTRDGAVFHPNGCAELWMPDNQVSSPFARRMLVADTSEQLVLLEEKIAGHRRRLEQLNARANELSVLISQTRQELDENRRKAAQAEGEHQSVNRDAERARARLAVVADELGKLTSQTVGDDEARGSLTAELQELICTRNQLLEQTAEKSIVLHALESVYSELSQNLTECRIQVSSITQQIEHAGAQAETLQTRIGELDRTIQGRSRGVMSYDESINRLTQETAALEANLNPMRIAAETLHLQLEETRLERAARQRELEKTDATLSELRRALDATRDDKNRAEIDIAESRMKRQNLIDHITNEYGLSADELAAHADPAWEGGRQPPVPEIEERAAALTADIQALGPVNLVAIEEYKELEERYTFLKAQEDDLLKSKEQILELITMINKKSAEMFQSTFEQANANFEKMFMKLFNGGQAKLVLLENTEDPLECGIDIIARPPGKRPQSVTLLSGGERTMTAVSLLFAIFMIKPAPFCMLDELDAALDDSNIGRFVQTLKDFLAHSQFLIITHNQHTIAGSDIVYGVTQQEKGISKIVSMRLTEIGVKELAVGAPEAVPTVELDTLRRPRKKKAAAEPAEPATLPLAPEPDQA
ncbi:MAG: hypothetical protein WCK89_09220 [bacterium]